jgi:hypothetical protein
MTRRDRSRGVDRDLSRSRRACCKDDGEEYGWKKRVAHEIGSGSPVHATSAASLRC